MTYRLKIRSKAIRQILRGDAIQKDILRRAEAIKAAAGGDGFEIRTGLGPNRARTSVGTEEDSEKAKKAEAEDRALTRAIDAGR